MPERIQLSRRKGWRMPENTVKVTRPGPFSNPFDFRTSEHCWTALAFGCRGDRLGRQQASVVAFRQWVTPMPEGRKLVSQEFQVVLEGNGKKASIGPKVEVGAPPTLDQIRAQLAGKNLACWCKPGEPCHADVLLELANSPACEEVKP